MLNILEYRVTPMECGYSPSELLMGRQLRSINPTARSGSSLATSSGNVAATSFGYVAATSCGYVAATTCGYVATSSCRY
ncbi:hypothetical protein DPMN_110411 [Dreissena polymorpha]|uniref:Uncharacterized protein n=1 Tax=Dreissena polymorpha TaxID=45954 RepID=A0A9D4KCI7_DREPO|nr:hypothetical protein DPMN_110411 [Dreissena polymorpha]